MKKIPNSLAITKTVLTDGYQLCSGCGNEAVAGDTVYSIEPTPGVRKYLHAACQHRLPASWRKQILDVESRSVRENGKARPSAPVTFGKITLPTMTFLKAGDLSLPSPEKSVGDEHYSWDAMSVDDDGDEAEQCQSSGARWSGRPVPPRPRFDMAAYMYSAKYRKVHDDRMRVEAEIMKEERAQYVRTEATLTPVSNLLPWA